MQQSLHCWFHKDMNKLAKKILNVKDCSKQLKDLAKDLWPPIKLAEQMFKSNDMCEACRKHKPTIQNIHSSLMGTRVLLEMGNELVNQQFIKNICHQAIQSLRLAAKSACLA